MQFDVNDFSLEELNALFQDDETPAPSTDDNVTSADATSTESTNNTESTETNNVEDKVTGSKAFAKRLKESTTAAVNKERENIAKQLGYESYEAMIKEREKKKLEDNGLDPEQVSPIIDDLVKKRLNDDPRMKELEEYRAAQIKEFGKKELAEITKLTDGAITRFDQLPKTVIDEWRKTGSLKAAYLAIEGENLIIKTRSNLSKGTTNHLRTPASNIGTETNTRPLTDDEKKIWKLFNPKLTDEELDKKLVNKK